MHRLWQNPLHILGNNTRIRGNGWVSRQSNMDSKFWRILVPHYTQLLHIAKLFPSVTLEEVLNISL
jgi:hypothetical protein